jgi:hypothetical protein
VAAVEAGEVNGDEHCSPGSEPVALLLLPTEPEPVGRLSLSPPPLEVQTAARNNTHTFATPPRPSGGAVLPELSPPTHGKGIRRRLIGKQPVPMPMEPEPEAVAGAEHTDVWGSVDEEAFGQMDWRRKYQFIYRKFRRWAGPPPRAGSDLQDLLSCGADDVQVPDAPGKHLNGLERRQRAREFLDATGAPDVIREYVDQMWPPLSPAEASKVSEKKFLYARNVLLTWQGDWGVFDPGTLQSSDNWRNVVRHLQQDAGCGQVWKDFVLFAADLVEFLGATSWAACFEVCMNTFASKFVLRVHAHMYLARESQKLCACSSGRFLFHKSTPHKSHKLATMGRRNTAGWAGCYYVLAPMVGSVFKAGSVRPFTDFPVRPDWVFNLVQAEKMEFKEAFDEMIACGSGFSRRMGDLRAWQSARQEVKLRAHVQAEQAHHMATNYTWRSFPAIASWLSAMQRPHLRRKSFLVLEGPSGLGKTEYVRSLCGPAATLELNADSMRVPYLREFDPEVHKVIFWDECSVQLVVENRKLFQCPAAMITLGVSPTGRDAYRVWVNDAVMVIGSNRWSDELSALKNPSDAEWIRANMTHVIITSKMYIDPAEG